MVGAEGSLPRQGCSIKEACACFGVGRTLIYDLIGKNLIISWKVGRRRVLCWPDLLRYFAQLSDD